MRTITRPFTALALAAVAACSSNGNPTPSGAGQGNANPLTVSCTPTGDAGVDEPVPAADAGAPLCVPNATCTACETEQCPDSIAGCDAFSAADRMACLALVKCVRETSCHTNDLLACYCGTADSTACFASLSSAANGPCRAQIELAQGTTDPITIENSFTDVTTPGGAALYLMLCDNAACNAQCIPYGTVCASGAPPSNADAGETGADDGGDDGTGLVDSDAGETGADDGGDGAVVVADRDAGEEGAIVVADGDGGGAGAGGGADDAAGPGGAAGDAGFAGAGGSDADSGEASEAGGGQVDASGGNAGASSQGDATAGDETVAACNPNALCLACESEQCPEFIVGCDAFSGADRDNCLALVRCVRDSGCHVNNVLDCYCGAADATQCLATTGDVVANGACKAQIEAAQGTTTPLSIENQFTDISTPGGAALSLMLCDTAVCNAECIPYGATCPN